MSTRLIVSAAAAAVATYIGGPGAGVKTFALVYGATGFLDPAKQVQGPRLDDLKTPSASYGVPISFIEGSPRVAPLIAWCSDKIEIAHTESQDAKGGPSVESTTFTYEIHLLLILAENPGLGVRRIWSNGALIWTAADDSDADSLDASANTSAWREIRFYAGADDQLPDPVYEAAVGIGNAPAYRGRTSVFIEGLNLGGSGQIPVLTLELTSPGEFASGDVTSLWGFDGVEAYLTASMYPPGPLTTASVSVTDQSFAGPQEWTLEGHDQGEASITNGVMTLGDYSLEGGGGVVLWTPPSARFAAPGDFTVEFRLDATGMLWTGGSDEFYLVSCKESVGTSDTGDWWFVRTGSGNLKFLVVPPSGPAPEVLTPMPTGLFEAAAVRRDGVLTLWINGVLADTQTAPPDTTALSVTSIVTIGGQQEGRHIIPNDYGSGVYSGFRFTRGVARYFANYSPGQRWTTNGDVIYPVPLNPQPLDEVVARQWQRAGLDPTLLDASALSGLSVRAMAVSQVTSPRQVLDNLAAAYLFEFVESGASVRAALRGGAPVATIPYDELGASEGAGNIEALPLVRGNELELAAQVTVNFANVDDDFQAGSESSPRLATGSTIHSVTEVPLGLTPTEAKRLANVAVTDAIASIVRVGPVSLTRKWASLEPTDVVLLTGRNGSTYRTRLLKVTDAGGVRTIEGVLDDATAVNSDAVTSGGYNSSTIVRQVADTELLLLDGPILRDADNARGIYALAKGDGTPWRGYGLYKSNDGVSFSQVANAVTAAVMGTCSEVPGAWAGGRVFDEVDAITVDVGTGTLSGATRDAVLNDQAVNAFAIGKHGRWMLGQFRDAALLSPGVYRLTGLLLGSRGTEWAIGTQLVGDQFALLRASGGIARVALDAPDLDVERKYKAVSLGRPIDSVTGVPFTESEVGLKPFSPFDARAVRAAGGGITLTWQRRTRLATKTTGPAGILIPLGEDSEAYQVDVFEDGSFTSVVRTIDADSTTAAYTTAQQTADFGSAQSTVHIRIYQLSAQVGRGYSLEASI